MQLRATGSTLHYFQIWQQELTINGEYIEQNEVYSALLAGQIVGYYSLIELEKEQVLSGVVLEKGFWLEHMFVEPAHIGQGIGQAMVLLLLKLCKKKAIRRLAVLADPHARGFYEKMGFIYLQEIPSTIPGRTTPMLAITIPVMG